MKLFDSLFGKKKKEPTKSSKGIEALINLLAPGSLFRPTNEDIKEVADKLLQEGKFGSYALASLIRELMECRSREITYALKVAAQILPTPELIDAVRAVTEASELTEAPDYSRFTSEIVGGGQVGWTSGTHSNVVRQAHETLSIIEAH